MELKIEIYSSLCATKVFEINGIVADVDDFGEHYDRNPDDAEDYGCGDMQFTMIEPTEEVLKRYCISKYEYEKVCDELDGLSFGGCGWCI